MNPVVVHGGGPEITAYMERLAHAGRVRAAACASATRRPSRWPRWCWSARSTRTSCCASTATASRPSGCQRRRRAASSASARQAAPDGTDVGFVGPIERVDVDVLNHVAQDYIPVIASIGADRDGQLHNINADEAAGAVARALGAYKVIFLTDVAGWLRDPADPEQRHLRGRRRRGRGRARPGRRAACGPSSRPASTRSTAASPSPTSSTAACRTRCCSSCSPTPGIGTKIRPAA